MGRGTLSGLTYFGLLQENALLGRINARRRSGARRRVDLAARVDELELDLMRVTLLARTLADLCLAKGLVTEGEFDAQLRETDFADGVADDGLDPKLARPGQRRLARLEPVDETSTPPRPTKPIVRTKKKR